LSGPDAHRLAEAVGVPRGRPARRVTRARLHRPDAAGVPGAPLDDALVTRFDAPTSFTGEDTVEFSVHGGPYAAAALLATLVEGGARPALPGEFTERAFLHGKLGLLEAEAIADLIEARSTASHQAALCQLDGALTRALDVLRDALLDLEALLAYDIDFPEEDDGPVPRARVLAAATAVERQLEALLATQPQAELGREGVLVVLAGPPNAGKSSLFNALAGAPRAIVSPLPGTTRDAIELLVDDDPLPLRLVDTAGLRSSDDALEQLGIAVSHARLAAAHVVLACAEDDATLRALCAEVAARSPAVRLAVRTKADLHAPAGDATAETAADTADARDALPGVSADLDARAVLRVSAIDGRGLPALRAALRAVARALLPPRAESLPLVTRARHVHALTAARAEVSAFLDAWQAAELPAPVLATHLRAAVHALDELLGGIDRDEVIARVFRTFCVGK
ncbi:MAG: 50S ribosome-binding GTPase, partial [Gemmatimonadaceae bacterium]|nr:50S ribosome-binding GTPase [Gemmatimonadaceae bacterium]